MVDAFPSDGWMQAVAGEVNLSETAFLAERADGDFDLRWWTPTTEVDLCGHATLAAAHVLGGRRRFHTRSGVLTCVPGPDGTVEMDFPADPPVEADLPAGLAEPGSPCARGRTDLVVELASAAAVRSYRPDLGLIGTLDQRAVIVTAPGDSETVDFVSRVFCPAVGVPEDPVTGSAHCTLAGYWAARTGRTRMTGYQASARGGTVRVRIDGDRVVIAGSAVTVARMELLAVPAA